MLVPLFEDAAGTVQVVLTQRAHTLSSHGGARASSSGPLAVLTSKCHPTVRDRELSESITKTRTPMSRSVRPCM